eukprot:scaffold130953_cov32-Tisochrysis_lutea.AAC.2
MLIRCTRARRGRSQAHSGRAPSALHSSSGEREWQGTFTLGRHSQSDGWHLKRVVASDCSVHEWLLREGRRALPRQ